MKHEIIGDDMQFALVHLEQREFIQAEAGSMLFMDESIEMDLKIPGGWVGGLKRMVVGESFMLPVFKSNKDNSRVAFAPPYPGKIIELEVNENKIWQAQKNSFLFSTGGISINLSFVKKFKVGFFGGEGFVLEKFTGNGKVFINCGGMSIEKTLQQNETIKVDTGCVVAFEDSVSYDVKRVGSLKTAVFGGEGLFLSTLTGPGKIYLQSLPWNRFRDAVFGSSGSKGILGDAGKILGGD